MIKTDFKQIEERLLHRVARYWSEYYKVRGYKVNKKYLRFNDCVEIGLHWERMGFNENEEVCEAGIKEAVLSCFKYNSDGSININYCEGGLKSMKNEWMEYES